MINTALAILQTDEQRNTLSDFYQTYKNRFYAIAYSKLHDRNLAEDAVQEAFSRIASKPETFFSLSHNKMIAYTDVVPWWKHGHILFSSCCTNSQYSGMLSPIDGFYCWSSAASA